MFLPREIQQQRTLASQSQARSQLPCRDGVAAARPCSCSVEPSSWQPSPPPLSSFSSATWALTPTNPPLRLPTWPSRKSSPLTRLPTSSSRKSSPWTRLPPRPCRKRSPLSRLPPRPSRTSSMLCRLTRRLVRRMGAAGQRARRWRRWGRRPSAGGRRRRPASASAS